ncbi:dentin sialophosphoprotein-like [Teleopsis dalmanni]|uniref:dentin sialophosphoprotein-like n=1 Tax=Teleopsis dalmanni TaxID=139649 RepID=UPI0018CE35E2|nr:dentin sialophosphoprotein-like [Teleopsis dalmanni]
MDLSPTTTDDLPTDCSTSKVEISSTTQNNNSTMLEPPFYCFETNYETFREHLNGTYHLTGDQDLITYAGLHDTLTHFRNTRINESLSSYLSNILEVAETTTNNSNHETQDTDESDDSDDSDTSSSDDSTSEEDFNKAENTLNTTENECYDKTLDNLNYIDKTEDVEDVELIDESSKQNFMDGAESANAENNDEEDFGVTKQPLTILETTKKEQSTVDDENSPQLDIINEDLYFEDDVSKKFIEQQSEICKPNQRNVEMDQVDSFVPKVDHAVSNTDIHFLDINTSSSENSENIYSLKYIYKELYGEKALRARLAMVARNEEKSNCTETCEPPQKKFAADQNEECLEEAIVDNADTCSSQDEELSNYKSNLPMIACDETMSDSCSSDDVSMNTMLDTNDWKFSSTDSE